MTVQRSDDDIIRDDNADPHERIAAHHRRAQRARHEESDRLAKKAENVRFWRRRLTPEQNVALTDEGAWEAAKADIRAIWERTANVEAAIRADTPEEQIARLFAFYAVVPDYGDRAHRF
jgi:hypothetical protein